MKKAKYSKEDTMNRLFVDCSECVRGGKGNSKDKCSSGFNIKRGRQGGCFEGKLLTGLVI